MAIDNNIDPKIPIVENNEQDIRSLIPQPGEWRDRLNQDIEDMKNARTPHLVQLLMIISIMKNDINLLEWSLDHGANVHKIISSMEITILRAYGFNMDLN